jgi:transposase
VSLAVPARCISIFSNASGQVFSNLWLAGLAEYDEMKGIAWDWQSIDVAMGKAPLAQECVGPNPTDRGRNGRKRRLLVDGRGVPLSLVASEAYLGDRDLLPTTLDQMVGTRPKPRRNGPKHLCADAGYRGDPAWNAARARHDRPHIKQRREEAYAKRTQPVYKARCWVVERAHSWLNRFRKLLVSFEKTEASYVAYSALPQP